MRVFYLRADDNGVEEYRVEVDPATMRPIGPKLYPGQPIPAKKGSKKSAPQYRVPDLPGAAPKPQRESRPVEEQPERATMPMRPAPKPAPKPIPAPPQRESYPAEYEFARMNGRIVRRLKGSGKQGARAGVAKPNAGTAGRRIA